MTEPGWYVDPHSLSLGRYWDGRGWTEHLVQIPPGASLPMLGGPPVAAPPPPLGFLRSPPIVGPPTLGPLAAAAPTSAAPPAHVPPASPGRPTMAARTVIAISVVGTLIAAGAVYALVSPGRSIENYCRTYAEHRATLSKRFGVEPGTSPLEGLSTGVETLGGLRDLYSDLADVAPDEIRDDTEQVAAGFSDMNDDMSDPGLFSIPSAMFTGLTFAAPLNRVERYTQHNCGA